MQEDEISLIDEKLFRIIHPKIKEFFEEKE